MKPQRIVIAGNGTSAWLVATALAGALGRERCSITVVGSGAGQDPVAPFARCDTIQPGPDEIRPMTGIDDDLLVARTGASFTWGIAFAGWSQFDASYFQPFAPAGASLGPVPFAHIVQKLRRAGHDLRFSSYSLASMAAQAGRFTRPVNQPDSVLSTCSYGMHLDSAALSGMLQRNAEALGIRHIDGDIADMQRNESGTFAAALLADGTRIDGDLFVDCSGDEARVLRHRDDDGWESWEQWLPTDRFVTTTIDADAAVAPYSLAQAFHAGWLHYVPTQQCASVTVFYRDGVASRAEAEDLLTQFAGVKITSSGSGATAFGRRSVFWRDNCIALGSAAVRIDPLGTTNLTLLQRAIASLLQLLPGEQRGRAEADEFNRRMQTLYDRARDFAFLHYKLNGRSGEAFWDECREIAATDSLDSLVNLYRSLGRIVLCDEEPFDESCWVNLLDEHGITPRQGYRVADGMRPEGLADHLERMRAAMIDELRRMPLHSDYLAGIGGDA